MADIVNGSADVVGVLTQKLPTQSGTSAKGNAWERTDIILSLDSNGNFPINLCIELFGERAHIADNIPLNSRVRVGINLSSREFNGRWFSSIRGWRIELDNGMQPQMQQPMGPAAMPNAMPNPMPQPQQPVGPPTFQQQPQQQMQQPQQPAAPVDPAAFDDLPF